MVATAVVAAGAALGLASVLGCISFQTIAQMEGIHDSRASDVSELFGSSLSLVWVVGMVLVAMGGRIQLARGTRLLDGLLRSRAERRFISLAFGICAGSLLVGAATIAVAWSPLVVTPPAAWLMMSAGAGLGAIASIQGIDRLARQRSQ